MKFVPCILLGENLVDKTKYLEAGKHNLDEQNVYLRYLRCKKHKVKKNDFKMTEVLPEIWKVQSFPVYLFSPFMQQECALPIKQTRER